MKVDFSGGYDSVIAPALTQWDKGQVLQIYGLNLPDICQVHFATAPVITAIPRLAYKKDGYSEVKIPNLFLEGTDAVHAHIYVNGATTKIGKTVKTVKIPITARQMPADFISEDDETAAQVLEGLLEVVSSGAIKGEPGDTYSITEEDYNEIADVVVDKLPVYDGSSEVEPEEGVADGGSIVALLESGAIIPKKAASIGATYIHVDKEIDTGNNYEQDAFTYLCSGITKTGFYKVIVDFGKETYYHLVLEFFFNGQLVGTGYDINGDGGVYVYPITRTSIHGYENHGDDLVLYVGTNGTLYGKTDATEAVTARWRVRGIYFIDIGL